MKDKGPERLRHEPWPEYVRTRYWESSPGLCKATVGMASQTGEHKPALRPETLGSQMCRG